MKKDRAGRSVQSVMETLTFRIFAEADRAFLERSVEQYYREDPGYGPVTVEHIRRTMVTLQSAPEAGALWVAEQAGTPIGYAIIVHYWSNELGGFVMVLDEFFVAPDRRQAGVGSAFLDFLEDTYRRRGFVATALEVTPGNTRARRLYERRGYRPHKNQGLLKWF